MPWGCLFQIASVHPWWDGGKLIPVREVRVARSLLILSHIFFIAYDGMPDILHVDTNLVFSSRFEMDLQ